MTNGGPAGPSAVFDFPVLPANKEKWTKQAVNLLKFQLFIELFLYETS
jgi:hypothetical protein